MTKNKVSQYPLLFIFPIVYLVIQILLIIDYKYFFLSTFDPAYGYLFNGLQIAQGNFELGMVQHPGTSLHCFIALNILIIHFLFGGSPLPQDVIINPEFYLSIISYELVLINTIALLFLGSYSFKRYKNIGLSSALQLTPFISVQGICFASAVMLEPILLFIEILILIILSEYAFGDSGKISYRNLIFIALLIALGIATKVVFIPLFFLPIFFIDGIRKRLLYTGSVLISFSVFLIPIYKVLPLFFGWIKNLFIHTGVYGSGEAKILDIDKFLNNVVLIFTNNYLFSAGFVIVIVTLILSVIPEFKHKVKAKRFRLLLGIAITIIINVLMAAKHYLVHYLIISHNLVVFGVLLSIYIYYDIGIIKYFKEVSPRNKSIIVFLMGFVLLLSLILRIHFFPNLKTPRLKALEYVENTIKETPRIILSSPNACPFREPALFFGYAFSGGSKKHEYLNILKRIYPESYFYNISEDRIINWDNEQNLLEILSKSNKTFLYSIIENGTIPPALMKKLNKLEEDNCILSQKTVFKNSDTKECIYEINVDTIELSKRIVKHEIAFCDCENISVDQNCFMSVDSLYKFDKAYLHSSENSYSGKYSIKLTKESPYGMDTKLIAKAGFYKIYAMRKSIDGKGYIVVSDGIANSYYKAVGSGTQVSEGWELINMTIDVPEEIVNKPITLYLWYSGDSICYFDDMRITHYEVR
jgi:hypothetical protein